MFLRSRNESLRVNWDLRDSFYGQVIRFNSEKLKQSRQYLAI